jgi:outer membrane immunogenic protein
VSYAKELRTTPLSNWAGFYLGVHGGYGWKENDFAFARGAGMALGGINSKGWVAGGQAGYNWQYGRVVGGLEADFSVANIKGNSDPFVFPGGARIDTLSDNVRYLGTARGRVGWLPFDNVLLYGTAGPAWERVNRTESRTDIVTPSSVFFTATTTARDHFGWVAGAGVETVLWNSNWIARLEYLHYDFGTVESTSTRSSTDPAVVGSADRGGRQTIDVVRAGFSYKFAPDGPIVARY